MLYYIVAVITGFVVFLIVALLLLRGQESSVDSTQIFRAKKQLFAAIQNIELDVRNLGSGKQDVTTVFPAGYIDTLTCTVASGFDCKFQFNGRVDSTSPDTALIQYLWRQDGTEDIDTDLSGGTDVVVNTQMYKLRRVVAGNQMFEVDRVSRFRIKLLDNAGANATNPLDIRQVDVDLKVLVPMTEKDEALEEVRWEGSFRPVNLTRLDS